MPHRMHAHHFMQGLERTRASVIQSEFQAVQGAQSVDEIRAALEDVHDALLDLDIFDDVDLSIEPSQEVRAVLMHLGFR